VVASTGQQFRNVNIIAHIVVGGGNRWQATNGCKKVNDN